MFYVHVLLASLLFSVSLFSAEIKFRVSSSDYKRLLQDFSDNLKIVEEKKRDIYFWDTRSFDYYRSGRIFRVRINPTKGKFDCTYKSRTTFIAGMTVGTGCEVDWVYPSNKMLSCSRKFKYKTSEKLPSDISCFQADFQGMENQLILRGPIISSSFEVITSGLELDFSSWDYHGQSFYEVSARADTARDVQKILNFLRSRNVHVETGASQTKTRWFFNLFSQQPLS